MIQPKIKQYSINLTLNQITVSNPISQSSKILCQVHHNSSFTKIPLQPTIKGGIASFYQQRFTVPSQEQIVLVVKQKTLQQQTYLGRYIIDCSKYIENKIWQIKCNEKLQGGNAYIDFEVEFVSKKLYEEQSSDDEILSEQYIQSPKKCVSQINQSTGRSQVNISKSAVFGSSLLIIRKQNISNLTTNQQQFQKILSSAESILHKHNLKQQSYNQVDKTEQLQSQKVQSEKFKSKIVQNLNESVSKKIQIERAQNQGEKIHIIQLKQKTIEKQKHHNIYLILLCVIVLIAFLLSFYVDFYNDFI